MMKSLMNTASVVALTATTMLTPATWAEDSNDKALEEIVVTANKRAEGLQDIGASVQALTNEQLVKAGVRDVSRLEFIAAGVQWGVYGNDAKIAIRGANSNNTFGDNASIAGMFVDGVYKQRAAQQTRAFFDVERLEVLKGPQGTLYGRNTFGGAINLITARPNLEETEGYLQVTAGRWGFLQTEAVLNVPLTDKVAFRVSGLQTRSDGWIENTAGPNLGQDDDYAIRAQLLWEPSDDTNVLLRFNHVEEQGIVAGLFSTAGLCRSVTPEGLTDLQGTELDCQNPRRGAGGPDADPNIYDTLRLDQVNFDFAEPADLSETGIVLEVNHQAETFAVKSITAWNDFNFYGAGDVDYSPNPYQIGDSTDNIESFSQEINFYSTTDGPLQWTAGLYFEDNEFTYGYSQFAFRADDTSARGSALDANGNSTTILSGTPLASDDIVYGRRFLEEIIIDSQIFGAFAQVDYSFTDAFRVIGGIRYNYEDKEGIGGQSDYTGLTNAFSTFNPPAVDPLNIPSSPRSLYTLNFGAENVVRPEESFEKFTWRGGFEYDVNEDVMMYGSVATGFLSGALSTNGVVTDDQESIAYEIGVKSRLFDNRLQVNLAGYYNEYDDLITGIQTTQPDGTVVTTSVNGGSIEAMGIDLEVLAKPTENSMIAFNLAWLDAEYGQFGQQNPYQLNGGVADNFLQLDGERAPFSPELSFNITGQYDFFLEGGSVLTPSVQFAYSDSFVNNGFNLPNLINGTQPSFTKTDVRLTWLSADGDITVEAFVENIENEITTTRTTVGGDDRLQTTPALPRNYGVRLRYNF